MVSWSASERRPRMATLQSCCASFKAMARPTPLPAPVITAVLVINIFPLRPLRKPSRPLRLMRAPQLHPPPRRGRLDRRVHHRLSSGAIVEAWNAGTLVANRIHELPRLIVTERDERIALARVAWSTRQFPEFFWNRDGFHSRPTRFARLEFVPLTCDEHKSTFAAVDLRVIETAPAFIAAGRELAAFQNARRAALELREEGRPIVQLVRLTATHRVPLLQAGHEPLHRANQQMRKINAVAEHVAKFPGAGEPLDLAPAEVAGAPVLQPAGAVVIRLTQIAAL